MASAAEAAGDSVDASSAAAMSATCIRETYRGCPPAASAAAAVSTSPPAPTVPTPSAKVSDHVGHVDRVANVAGSAEGRAGAGAGAGAAASRPSADGPPRALRTVSSADLPGP